MRYLIYKLAEKILEPIYWHITTYVAKEQTNRENNKYFIDGDN